LARCQPIFKKKKKKKEKRRRKKEKRKENEKWIIPFSVSGSSQRSSVFTSDCHLPPASLLSPPAASVSFHHWPPFSIFKLKLLELFTLNLMGILESEYNIIDLYFLV
jgi:hypothetical protein